MNCDRCGTKNKAGAKFCIACGVGLTLACKDCGQLNPFSMKFCSACGAKTAAAPAAESTPKIETPTPIQIQQEPTEPAPAVERIQASIAPLEVDAVTHADVIPRDLNSTASESPSVPTNLPLKRKSKWLLVGSSATALAIGLGGAGVFYFNHSTASASKPVAIAASQMATAQPVSPAPTSIPTPMVTPLATPEMTASPEATAAATALPITVPTVSANTIKTTTKPKPSRSPKPTRSPAPARQTAMTVEHEAPAIEAPTPRPSGFAERFAACSRLDFLNKTACEVKLCFNNAAAAECKHEPSVQDRQRR